MYDPKTSPGGLKLQALIRQTRNAIRDGEESLEMLDPTKVLDSLVIQSVKKSLDRNRQKLVELQSSYQKHIEG